MYSAALGKPSWSLIDSIVLILSEHNAMTKKNYTLYELANLTASTLIGDPNHKICNVADLENATSEDVSFLNKMNFGQASRYDKAMRKSIAGAIFVHPDTELVEGRNFLLNENPSRAFQQVIEILKGSSLDSTGFSGIHSSAIIHDTAKIGNNVQIGPHAVIDKQAVIGDNTFIGAGTYVGPHTAIGTDCFIFQNVTIREKCVIGDRVILQCGAVIGSCGFGYTTDKNGKHTKLNQMGSVVIEDDVEIGANTTIDRSRFKETRIGKGTKIDNLVQIGHGASIGQDNLIVAQVGIAGSTETGRHVVMGGQSAITGHVKIANGIIIAARSGVTKSLTQPGKYGGVPAMPLQEFNRMSVRLHRLEEYEQKLKNLEAKLALLEEKSRGGDEEYTEEPF